MGTRRTGTCWTTRSKRMGIFSAMAHRGRRIGDVSINPWNRCCSCSVSVRMMILDEGDCVRITRSVREQSAFDNEQNVWGG